MSDGLQLSARTVSSLLAQIFGPAIYDLPRFGGGDPSWLDRGGLVSGPQPDPWRAVMLNPQPLPPRETYALALADAHIQQLLSLDDLGGLMGGQVGERALDRAGRSVADLIDICPEWPRWPRGWPKGWPPPPPPPWPFEVMTPTALLVFGSRFLAASELVEQEQLRTAIAELGGKALTLSMEGAGEHAAAS